MRGEATACGRVQLDLYRARFQKSYLDALRERVEFFVCDKMSDTQTCVTNTCISDTGQESLVIRERNTNPESLPDNSCFETKRIGD